VAESAGDYHPQTCGKVERFHQTLKKWLDRQPRPHTVRQLQALLDQHRDYYNQVRPHRALDRRTPTQAYTPRPKAVPTATPIDTGHYRVRHDRIDGSGVITLRHNSRLHHIGLGRRHAGTRVVVLVRDRHIRVLDTDGELLRDLQLDPSRDRERCRETPVNGVPRHHNVPPAGFEPAPPPPEAGRCRDRRSLPASYLGFLFAARVSGALPCAVVRSTRHSTTSVLKGRDGGPRARRGLIVPLPLDEPRQPVQLVVLHVAQVDLVGSATAI
jgi:hypothetical protein